MKSYSIVRPATDDDLTRLGKAAKRFLRKRGLATTENLQYCDWQIRVEHYLHTTHPEDRNSEIRAWQRAFCRATGEPYRKNLTLYAGYIAASMLEAFL